MSNLRFNKVKSNTPITLIIHGGNRLGYKLTKALIDQKGYVVVIDKFNLETRKYVSELKRSDLVDFFDFKGFDSVFKNIKRFDYVYYLLEDKLSQEEFDSKEFLSETKQLELCLAHAKKNDAKFALITSLGLNRELVNRINNTGLATPTPYSNIELQKYCETLVAEFKDKSNINARILRIGTLIGKGIDKVKNPILDQLFKEATNDIQITIKGEGLDIYNLIHEDDAVYGILKLTFSNKTKGEVISLANKNDYTLLSLAYKLLELNTEAQSIRFVDNPEENFLIQDLYVPAPHATKYGWTQQITLEKAMIEQIQVYYDNINKSWDIAKKESPKKTEIKQKKHIKETKTELGEFIHKLGEPLRKIKTNRRVSKPTPKAILQGFLIAITAILFAYFVAYPILGTTFGLMSVKSTATDILASINDIPDIETSQNFDKLEKSMARTSDSFSNMAWMFELFGKDDVYSNMSRVLIAGENTIDGGRQLVEAISPLMSYVREFEPAVTFQDSTASTTREYREQLREIDRNKHKIEDAAYKIQFADQLLKNVNTSVFPKFAQDKVLEIKDVVKKAGEATVTYQEAVTFLPDILGAEERKRYLILLQNESEIRSTGGWITSYGVVGIEGGQIRELFVDDIYNAEGTLKVQGKKYPAPASMMEALELRDWTFSLVNWSPDLTETRIKAEQFISDLGKGNKIDGIVTIDIAFFQKLLDKWGGIEVPGEDELITAQNINEKVFEMHREFTPGSTQKTTFLANLANEIVKKLLSMNFQEILSISDVLESSLNEKHLQVAFDNNKAFNFFNSRNWAGSLDNRYKEAPVLVDWNWGGNKANQYLNKSHSLLVNIKDEDTITFQYTLSVENTSTSNSYPQGDYKNYQRVYIPPEAQILKISGMEEGKHSIYRESGFKIIGGWFNVPVGKISTLEISYQLNRGDMGATFPLVEEESAIFFDLDIFKQAGERKHAYKLDIIYPSTWVLVESAKLNTISNQLSGRFDLSRDMQYKLMWNKPS